MGRQMLRDVLAQAADVGADDEAQVHRGVGPWRDRVHRMVRVAGAKGQHLQRVPGDHPLHRAQPRFAPVRVDDRVARRAVDPQPGQRGAHRIGDRRRAQPRHHHPTARIHEAGDGVREHRAGVAQQPAPVARVVGAFAQAQREVEVGHPARAQEDRGPVALPARAVAGDQRIGGERLPLRGAESGQAGRAGLLAGLEQPGGVETEPAARGQHLCQRGEVDAVLALVVGRAAPVQPLAVGGKRPRAHPARPGGVLASDDVAVPVHQHRRQGRILVPRGHQQRPGAGHGVVVHPRAEAQGLEGGLQFVVEVGAQARRCGRVLAFGADCDASREVAREAAAVEMGARQFERVFAAAHGRCRAQEAPTSVKCSTTGGCAKNGPTMARHCGNSGPWRKCTVWSSRLAQRIVSR